ncbi:sigma factor G inhibitor Gin [Alicyclobacillus ferrooxydans]|uniref:sigma factor G inhibitor Gin n=1 Tax=Alicyclobacillus ferrooxydans TaxID=471514 RepID=UPI001FE1DA53|nr:sigma factor G inhibitor Gin [Alicyclobacillus ferrooxydans]
MCGVTKSRGLHICGKFVCEECERQMVRTDVSDPLYRHYIECMKEIWLAAIS